jgi:hypothetical protein
MVTTDKYFGLASLDHLSILWPVRRRDRSLEGICILELKNFLNEEIDISSCIAKP